MVKKISKSNQTYLFKRYYPEIFIFLSLFFLLIFKLNHFPSFGDEVPLIQFGWILKKGGQYFGYIDAMMPLFSFIASYTLRIFGHPLFAGRMVSVMSGIFGVFGVYILIKSLSGRVPAILSSVLYALLPITFFYHRFALRESLLLMAGIYVLLFSYLLTKTSKKWLCAFGIAVSLVAALSTKQNGIVYFAFPFLFFISYKSKKELLKWILLSYLFTLILLAVIYIPQLKAISAMKQIGTSVGVELVAGGTPINNFIVNLKTLFGIFSLYIGFSLLLALVFLFYQSIKHKNTNLISLLVYPLLLLAVYIFASPGFFERPRYLMPFILPWIVISGTAIKNVIDMIWKIKPKYIKYLLTFVAITLFSYPSLNFIIKYFFAPENIPLNKYDRSAFISSPSAGFGLFEAFDYLKDLSKTSPILVVTEQGTGPKNWPLMLFENSPTIQVAQWPGFRTTSLAPYLNMPAYVVLDDDPVQGGQYYFKQVNPDAELIKRYWRPGKETYIDIMLIKPKKNTK